MHGTFDINGGASDSFNGRVQLTEALAGIEDVSAKALKPIPTRVASRILRNKQLHREAEGHGLSLHELVSSLRRPPADRVKAAGNSNVMMLEMLANANVQFVLIGGLAGCAYGARGKTKDLDICHQRESRNLGGIVSILKELGAEFRRLPQHVPPIIDVDTLLTEMDFVFTTREHGDFDLIGEFTAVGVYDNAVEDALNITIDHFQVPVLSLPKLAAAKKSTGRPKDLAVWHELQLIQKALLFGFNRPPII
jgi:hypothetical protein